MAQAWAAGLKQDQRTRALGRADGEAGMFRLTAEEIVNAPQDALAYLCGFREGQIIKRRKGG